MSDVAKHKIEPKARDTMHEVTEAKKAALPPSAAEEARRGFSCRGIRKRHHLDVQPYRGRRGCLSVFKMLMCRLGERRGKRRKVPSLEEIEHSGHEPMSCL